MATWSDILPWLNTQRQNAVNTVSDAMSEAANSPLQALLQAGKGAVRGVASGADAMAALNPMYRGSGTELQDLSDQTLGKPDSAAGSVGEFASNFLPGPADVKAPVALAGLLAGPLHKGANIEKLAEAMVRLRNGEGLQSTWKATGWGPSSAGRTFQQPNMVTEIPTTNLKLDPKRLRDLQDSGVTAPLGDIVSGADEAMAAYPGMKNIPLLAQSSKNPYNAGAFSPSLGRIRLEVMPGDSFKGNSVEDVTKHELQHYISREESTLRGSDTSRVAAAFSPADLDNLEQRYAHHLLQSGSAQGEAAMAAQAIMQGGNPNLRGHLAYLGSGGEIEARNAPMRDLFPHLQDFAPRQTQDIRGNGVLHYNNTNDIRGQILQALMRMAP